MLYVPCQQLLSHAGMISCLPGSNQYQAADKMSCSSTHLHSESVGAESQTSSPSIPSLINALPSEPLAVLHFLLQMLHLVVPLRMSFTS